MDFGIWKHRKGFKRLISAISKGQVTLGFIGGSITEAKNGNRWPEYIVGWFVNKFPDVRFYVENAAIGATGSDLAVFRVERDIIDRNCDIVFIEYAVNDTDESERRMRSREGLIRKLLREERDLVITYTYKQAMYEDILYERVPLSIMDFEILAEHYGIGSVWMGLYALEEVRKGMMKWEEWLPDGVHTEYRGSYCYAQSVIKYLEEELSRDGKDAVAAGNNLPKPYNPDNWQSTGFVDFSEVRLEGPWSVRSRISPWIDQILYTASVGAKLFFSFKGKGLTLGFDYGKASSEFRYRIDNEPWRESERERPWWLGDSGWYRIEILADDLENTEHKVEIEVIHGNLKGTKAECKGTNFNLAFIGYIS